MRLRLLGSLMAALIGLFTGPLAAQDQASEQAIHPLSLSFDGHGLKGEGAQPLIAAMRDAQFVLVGEDHGYAGSPQLLDALATEGAPFGFEDYAVEVGPFSAEWALGHLRAGGADALASAFAGRPVAMPFLNLREEAEVASRFTAPGHLWGVDQEFLGATLVLLPGLVRRGEAAVTKVIAETLDAERAAFAAKDFGGGMMVGDGAARLEALRDALAGDPEALEQVDALARSAEIYGYYSQGRGLDNNFERVALIRENFLSAYAAARVRKGAPPRVLMKFGAVHLSRATTPMSTFDLGMLVEGMAAENGMGTLRIAYLPLGGEGLGISPSPDGWFAKAQPEAAELRAALAKAGVDLAPIDAGQGHFLVPLAPVVRALGNQGLREVDPMTRSMILGFDYLVTTSSARPAEPLATD